MHDFTVQFDLFRELVRRGSMREEKRCLAEKKRG